MGHVDLLQDIIGNIQKSSEFWKIYSMDLFIRRNQKY